MNRKHKGLMFDENGNVVCEPNAEFGSDVEVDGALTINSATDLKTKDGSSLGDTIPTLEITQTDDGMFLTSSSLAIAKSRVGTHSPIGKATIDIYEHPLIVTIYENTKINEGFTQPFICSPMFINLELINIWSMITINLDTGEIKIFPFTNYTGFAINDTNVILADDTFAHYYETMYINTINGKPIVSGTESKDIKVQSTLYRHTITIDNFSKKAKLTFMTESEKNTEVDSVQDLIAVFGNTTLGVNGFAKVDTFGYILLTLNVGTSIDTTNVGFIEDGSGESVQLSFSDIFGTTGFTITDNVTAM